MSFLTESVTVPIWFLIIMNIILVALLGKIFLLVYRFKRGEIIKEEYSDMVVWKVKTSKHSAPKQKQESADNKQKQQKQKQDLVQVLKILLKEGDRGVLMKTIADRMGCTTSNARHAMDKLVENKLVDEVVGVSGTKYYLTQQGRDYCQRKSK